MGHCLTAISVATSVGALFGLGTLFMAGAGVLVGAATDMLLGRHVRRRWAVIIILTNVWAVVATVMGLEFMWRTGPLMFALGSVHIASGIGWWRVRRPRTFGTHIAAFGLVLSGIHILNFPFLANVTWTVPWGFAAATVLVVLIGYGVVIEALETALQSSEQAKVQNERFFELAAVGAFRSSLAGAFTQVNPRLVDILGYASREELYALRIPGDLYMDPSQRSRLQEEHTDAGVAEGVALTWKRKDGSPVYLKLHGRIVFDDDGKPDHYEGFIVDVSEARELQEQLVRAQRMEAVGQLAGGVAHDFNNLLTVVLASAALIQREPGKDEMVLALADDIAAAAERGASLTTQLLTFAHKQPMKTTVVDFGEVVEATVHLLRRTIPASISIVIDEMQEHPVLADRGQLQQVIMNLIINARNAMPSGGELRLSIEQRRLSWAERAENKRTDDDRDFAILTVADTGVGMSEEVMGRVFEPFFTTREVGAGSGLGLSLVFGIVTRMEGFVAVDSEPGEGTAFQVFWPVAEAQVETVAHRKAGPLRTIAGLCLLVEDEDAVRQAVCRMLEDIGLSVVQATDGNEALETLAALEQLDLLVSDLMMPGTSGVEVAKVARKKFPSMPIVCMSGYAEGDGGNEDCQEVADALLCKPFRPEELEQVICRVFDAGRASRAK